jgi:hypothetical protein
MHAGTPIEVGQLCDGDVLDGLGDPSAFGRPALSARIAPRLA